MKYDECFLVVLHNYSSRDFLGSLLHVFEYLHKQNKVRNPFGIAGIRETIVCIYIYIYIYIHDMYVRLCLEIKCMCIYVCVRKRERERERERERGGEGERERGGKKVRAKRNISR